uniref:Uncharacterized protein n=1 Tax=Lepeophtheirus salmonis TaxID=72036 RepID=A0A0K2SYB6_LEPSM
MCGNPVLELVAEWACFYSKDKILKLSWKNPWLIVIPLDHHVIRLRTLYTFAHTSYLLFLSRNWRQPGRKVEICTFL